MQLQSFVLREPVSAWSHGFWFLIALPGAALLWRRAQGDRPRQLTLLCYLIGLVACSGASTLYHAIQATPERLAFFLLLDYIGIYLLIAGTYTPIAWTLLEGPWRSRTLVFAWLTALIGILLHVGWTDVPPWVSTGLYLMMGWGAIFFYTELTRRYSSGVLRPLLAGGVLYSIGAIIHIMRWPAPWPGVVGAHEVFHGFVVAGSLAHYFLMYAVIAPWPAVASPLAVASVPALSQLIPFREKSPLKPQSIPVLCHSQECSLIPIDRLVPAPPEALGARRGPTSNGS